MTREFRPLVPEKFQGTATFSITNNRINRLPTTTAPTPSTSSDHTQPQASSSRGEEVAAPNDGLPNIQPKPVTPTKNVPQKIVLNTSSGQLASGAKVVFINGISGQLKPVTLKRTGDPSQPQPLTIKRPNNKSFAPILPYGDPQQVQVKTEVKIEPAPPPRTIPGQSMASKQPAAGVDTTLYPKAKKPCNCTKSMCLKLYCDCFANGEFCSGCNCQNCHNNIEHESERSRSIKTCLERNPYAFHPKIGKGFQGPGPPNRHHNKGCHCKRSGCLKNYCECYEAKIPCSSLCKCMGCKNYTSSHSTLQQLADVAVVRHQQQHAVKQKFNSQLQSCEAGSVPDIATSDNLTLDCLSVNLAAATCRCLLSAANHSLEHLFSMETIEKAIIEEFGQCLNKIIDKGTVKEEVKEES